MKFPLLLFCLILFCIQCEQHEDHVNLHLIPYPDVLESDHSYSSITRLQFPGNRLTTYRKWLESEPFLINESENPNVKLTIDSTLKPRTYILDIRDAEVYLNVHDKSDIRNALVTILQIAKLNDNRLIQCHIEDTAEFDYRGMHLDVARHFYDINQVKKYIDYLTFYKFNKFHWHLTDDQGWRIEIKQYPKLQEIAAFRNETLVGHYNDQPHQFDGKKYGGYYTQKEIKEVVAYAKSRGISIIPEIEMPGHASAAIAAYPELGCEDKQYEVATKWGVFEDVFCPKEETFEFLENVLDEVTDLFPSEFIHVGGDECPKEAWKSSRIAQDLMKKEGLKDENELQSYFIDRMAKYLKTKGKTIIGWDEILEGGLSEGAAVMSWRGEKGGIQAAKAGHEVIMTPGSHCYFDHYQSTNADEPTAIGGLTTVEDVYDYTVIPSELTKSESIYILGAQGNVWTEYISSFSHVEYMALARMIALSEVLFNDNSDRDIDKFRTRLRSHTNFWKAKGVNIADHLDDISVQIIAKPGRGAFAIPSSKQSHHEIQYNDPTGQKKVRIKEEVLLNKPGVYEFYSSQSTHANKVTVDFIAHKANKATIDLAESPSSSYPASGITALINGVLGSNEKYGGDEWMGFAGRDFEAVLSWEEKIDIQGIELRFFKGEGQWIYLPKEIQILSSDNNKTYVLIARKKDISTEGKIATINIPLDLTSQYVKIKAINHGEISEGKQGAGHKAWLFIDEIVIK